MRAVVTGGAGFVGSHLIEALRARGDRVVCIERRGADRAWVSDPGVAFHDVGLDDARALRPLVRGTDVVFHLAALTHARRPEEYVRVNADGTARLFEAIAGARGGRTRPPRVVFVSSIAAIGPCRNGERLSACSVPTPISAYGRSKLAAEAVVHGYADRVPSVILRFSAVYGPRDRGVLPMFRLARRGLALTIGGGEREVSMTYVADAVAALLGAADAPRGTGRTYCVAHPETVCWSRFLERVEASAGRRSRVVELPVSAVRAVAVASEGVARLRGRAAYLNRDRLREVTQPRWVCDPADASRDLGFAPAWPIDRGVPATMDWYRTEGWLS
ncbi:MAG: NAD-dependent epimerase/dehydratase family protein [Hyphomicrobiales bacterium]